MALTDADRLHMVAMALMRYSVVTVKAGESLINYNKKLTPMDNLSISYGSDICGSDITSGQSYFAYSEYSSSYSADKAFDDSTSTTWRSVGTSTDEYIGVDFGTGKAIKLITIKNYSSYGTQSFTLEGSNDNSSWSEIYSDTALNTTDVQRFPIANTNSYRYYRIRNAGTSWNPGYIRIICRINKRTDAWKHNYFVSI